MGICQGTSANPIYAKYDLHEKLGSGTFATVRRIVNKKDPSDEKALKITSLRNLKTEEVAALRNEVTILQEIQHDNVVRLYENFQTKDKIYMVQDLLSGGELFDRIIEQTFFSEKEAAKCVSQIANALQHLHANNVVHRDLKPENLLLTNKSDSYDIKIIDFGLAKQSAEMMSMPCGTPGYVAPEILKRRKYHKEVDIWSLGVITYILLCGFPPFHDDGNNLKNLYKQIRAGKYSFPEKYWSKVSDNAKQLIRKMLTVKPKLRITAEGISKDQWITTEAPDTNLGSTYGDRLRQTQALAKLRKGVRVILALKKMIAATDS
jgi:calcium/calmodulin-dependent protein kinase I